MDSPDYQGRPVSSRNVSMSVFISDAISSVSFIERASGQLILVIITFLGITVFGLDY
jgi:hypothetical protein